MYKNVCFKRDGWNVKRLEEWKKRQFGRKGLKGLKRWVIKSQEINYRYIIVIIARL